MTKFALLTMLLCSILVLFCSNHPLMMGGMIISQAMIMGFITTKSFYFNLFSYFLFMVYLGGILMLFSYIISITYSKEPLMTIKKKTMFFTGGLFVLIFGKDMNLMELSQMDFKESFASCYSNSFLLLTALMILLLLIMILVVFITEASKGTMRAK